MTGPAVIAAAAAASGWTATQTAVLIGSAIAVSGSILVAGWVNWFNQRTARRTEKGKSFGEALNAIEDYAEMPYRIRRRASTPEARHDISAAFGKIKSKIQFHLAWLQIEAPEVYDAYRLLDEAARNQAGRQASQAWLKPPLLTDAEMNLGVGYPRDQIDLARNRCISAMLRSLGRDKEALKLPISGPSLQFVQPPTRE